MPGAARSLAATLPSTRAEKTPPGPSKPRFEATADPERFEPAIEWFRSRVPMTREMVDALGGYSGSRAWTITGVAQLNIVQDVHESLARAIEKGTPLKQWQDEIEKTLTDAWGRQNAPRIETIYRNATQQALNAGRWREMQDPDIKAIRPFGFFDAIDDLKTSDFCRRWNKTVLPLDEFAKRRACPQCHHRCFPAGTLILTQSGPRPIEQIAVGDLVLTHTGSYRRVTATMRSRSPKRLIKVRCRSGAEVSGTANHPALTQRGWVEFAALRPGDSLVNVSEVIAAKHHSIADTERRKAGSLDRVDTVKRKTLAHLAELDRKVGARQVEVHEHHFIGQHHRVLKHELAAGFEEPIGEAPLGLAGSLYQAISHPLGIVSHRLGPRTARTSHDVAPQQTSTTSELLGDGPETGMGLLGVALGPVQTGACSARGHGAHDVRRQLAPSAVIYPLSGNGRAAVADFDAELGKEFSPERNARARKSEAHRELAEGQLLSDVQGTKNLAEVVAILSEQSGLGAVLERFSGHDWLDASGDYVFNIAVDIDESYVASGIVVHNCRSHLRNIGQREVDRRGGLTTPPKIKADNGFGAAPTDQEFTPDPAKYDPQLFETYKAKRKQLELKAARPEIPLIKPEHTIEHWEAHYADKYGDAARQVAHGRAAHERGLDMASTDAVTELERLQSRGIDQARHPADYVRFLQKQAGKKTATIRELIEKESSDTNKSGLEFAATLAGHSKSLAGKTAAIAGFPEIEFTANVAAARRAELTAARTKAATFYENLSAGSLQHPGSTWTVKHVEDRAFANEHQRLISFTAHGTLDTTLEHEWAHTIEFLNPKIRAQSVAFLKARTAGEQLEKLSVLVKHSNYEAWEVARPDDFHNAYIGKDYSIAGNVWATEVLSMGVQEIGAFLQHRDSEMLFFVLGQLADA